MDEPVFVVGDHVVDGLALYDPLRALLLQALRHHLSHVGRMAGSPLD